ncbi:MAG: sigma-70 family RNA polymerase sigma factor [Bacteroidota bacterium]
MLLTNSNYISNSGETQASEVYRKPAPMQDEEAIRAAKKDPKAYEVLYKKYYHQLFRFIHKRIQNLDDSADIASTVFVKSFKTISEFEYKGIPYSSWLYRVAVNECNQYFNKRKTRYLVIDDKLENSISQEIEVDLFKEKVKSRLPEILNLLKPIELELIELRFYEGMSFKEIGDVLNMSENHSKVKTFRIVKKLKTLLTND